MNDEEARQGLPANTDTNRAPRVAGDAAGNSDRDQGRVAFMRLCAHLRRRHGRVHFHSERRGIAA